MEDNIAYAIRFFIHSKNILFITDDRFGVVLKGVGYSTISTKENESLSTSILKLIYENIEQVILSNNKNEKEICICKMLVLLYAFKEFRNNILIKKTIKTLKENGIGFI